MWFIRAAEAWNFCTSNTGTRRKSWLSFEEQQQHYSQCDGVFHNPSLSATSWGIGSRLLPSQSNVQLKYRVSEDNDEEMINQQRKQEKERGVSRSEDDSTSRMKRTRRAIKRIVQRRRAKRQLRKRNVMLQQRQKRSVATGITIEDEDGLDYNYNADDDETDIDNYDSVRFQDELSDTDENDVAIESPRSKHNIRKKNANDLCREEAQYTFLNDVMDKRTPSSSSSTATASTTAEISELEEQPFPSTDVNTNIGKLPLPSWYGFQSIKNSSSILKLNNVNTVQPKAVAYDVHEMRSAVLDRGLELKDLEFRIPFLKTSNGSNMVINGKDKRLVNDKVALNGKNGGASLGQTMPQQDTITKINGNSNTGTNTERKKEDVNNHKDAIPPPFNHEVLRLIQQRAETRSKPGNRAPNDTAHLALSIEGGGMRGAVSAGMAKAISLLGLSDSFDSIYGSSAGSVIGAYMVSQQVNIDVYTKLLTEAKSKFVSKARLALWVAGSLMEKTLSNQPIITSRVVPAMNISFVLDEIMDPHKGLRPLEIEKFRVNNVNQPLRIVTSSVDANGNMDTICLGAKEGDFFGFDEGAIEESDHIHSNSPTFNINGKRDGLFACLESSMTVPAAAGPPHVLIRNKDIKTNRTTTCFDAFCYEPIPYRSAVEEGATHVLVLRSRPDGTPIGTKPGIFEKAVAPVYFDSNGMPQVSSFFEKGGQQYLYVEDYLTLDEGKNAGEEGVSVPPAKILYGVDRDEEVSSLIRTRSAWKKAHLLPVVVPKGNAELSTISTDRDEVLIAVRQGFAAAFDILSPSSELEFDEDLTGESIAELMFPKTEDPSSDILNDLFYFSDEEPPSDFSI